MCGDVGAPSMPGPRSLCCAEGQEQNRDAVAVSTFILFQWLLVTANFKPNPGGECQFPYPPVTHRPANCDVCQPWAVNYIPGDVVEPCLRSLLCKFRARRTRAGHRDNKDDFFPDLATRERLVHLTAPRQQSSRTSTPTHTTQRPTLCE